MDGIVSLVFLLLLIAITANFAFLVYGLYLSLSEAAATAKHFYLSLGFTAFTLILAVISAAFVETGIGAIPFVIFVALVPVWLFVCSCVSKKAKMVHFN